jgi:hypothetical protein
MKLASKLIIGSMILATSGVALAHHGRHHHGHHHGYQHFHHRPVIVHRDWVAPLVLGGIAGAIIVKEANKPVVVEQPVQVIPRATVVECTEWKEIQTSDGQVYKERTCTQK